jgi:cytochrome-b5 reductase
MALQTYTLEEIAKHTTDEDCWIIIHNKVYNVSSYFEEHPGGAEVLKEFAGLDSTEAFEDAGHSDSALDTMETLLVGDLAEEHKSAEIVYYRTTHEHVAAVPILQQRSTIKTLQRAGTTALAAVIIGGAAYYSPSIVQSLRSLSPARLRQLLHIPRSLPKLQIGAATHTQQFWVGVGTTAAVFSVVLGAVGNWVNHHFLSGGGGGHGGPTLPSRSQPDYRALKKKVLPGSTANGSTDGSAVTKEEVINNKTYSSYPLLRKEELGPNVYLLVFKLPDETDILPLPTGQHVSVQASINGTLVARSYTPLSNARDPGIIELVIKVYPTGLLTPHLGGLDIGETVGFRGPTGAMKYKANMSKRLLMVAGGTGITPCYQVIRAVVEDASDTTTVQLVYANNTYDDILVKSQLDQWAIDHPEKFRVHYVLVTPPEKWEGGVGFVSKETLGERLVGGSPEEERVLICGPPPMVNAVKGHLKNLGLEVPGAVSRAADKVFVF